MPVREWPAIDVARIRAIVSGARGRGAATLLEPDARAVLEAMGIAVPRPCSWRPTGPMRVATGRRQAAATLEGDRVVVRVVAPDDRAQDRGRRRRRRRRATPAAIRDAIAAMRDRLAGREIAGFLVAEFVDHDPGIGGSLLIAARWTDDIGPIVSVGAGGIDAEALAADLRPGREIAILSPRLTPARGDRGHPARLDGRATRDGGPARPAAADADGAAARRRGAVPGARGFVPARRPGRARGQPDRRHAPAASWPSTCSRRPAWAMARGPGPAPAPRPVAKLPRMFEPRSIALIGVSARHECRARHPAQPAAATASTRPASRCSSPASTRSTAAGACRTSPRCPARSTCSSSPSRRRRRRGRRRGRRARCRRDDPRDPGRLRGEAGHGGDRGADAGGDRRRRAPGRTAARSSTAATASGFRSVPGRIDTMFIPASKLPPPGAAPRRWRSSPRAARSRSRASAGWRTSTRGTS